MTEENNKQFMSSFIEEVINQQNLDAIDKIVSKDFIEHVPFPGQGPGRVGQNLLSVQCTLDFRT